MSRQQRTEWIAGATLVVLLLGGVFAFGELRGQLKVLDPDRIRDAQKEAAAAVRKAAEGMKFMEAEKSTWVVRPHTKDLLEEVELLSASEGLCYLTRVQGPFDGVGEMAQVTRRGGSWFLQAKSGKEGGAGVEAEAACWRFPVLEADQ